MANTVNEGFPLMAASQAQKHVTHNQAIEAIDARIATWLRVNWTYPVIGSTGVLTIASSAVVPAPFSGSADDITSISGGSDGTILVIAGTAGVTLTVVDGGNMKLSLSSHTLNDFDDTLTLIKRGTDWLELGVSNNG